MPAAEHCTGCGLRLEDCGGGCQRELDPPRFCENCGRRMAVQVTPTGWTGRCRGCGAEVEA